MTYATLDPVGDYEALLTQETPDTDGLGLPLNADDPAGYRLSVQVAQKVPGASIWDSYNSGPGWDDALWDDPEILQWVDVTQLVRAVGWTTGRNDPLEQPAAGTATIVLANLDGVASPWSQSGDLSEPVDGSDVVSLFRGGNLIRFGVVQSGGGWTPMFGGRIETATEDVTENADAYTTVTAIDLLGILSGFGRSLGHRAIPDGTAGTVIAAAMLADISWPYAFVNAAPHAEDFALIAPDPNSNRLQALQLIAASCDGFVAAAPMGLLLLDEASSDDLGVTFANNPDIDGGEFPYVDATTYASTDRLLNVVVGTAAIEGAEPQKAKDPLSIYRHGEMSTALGWPRTDLLQVHDADVKTLVQEVVARQANDFIGFSALSLDTDQLLGTASVLSYFASAGVFTQSQFTVRKVHPSGLTYTAVCKIVGLSSTLTALGPASETAAKWEMTLQLATLSATVTGP